MKGAAMLHKRPTTGSTSQRITRRAFTTGMPTMLLLSQHRANASQTPQATPAGPPATSGPSLGVTPTEVRIDDRFDVWLIGLQTEQEVTLSSTFVDLGGTMWQSEATFVADATGYLNPAMQQPIAGTYDVADTMGLIWSAQAGGRYRPPTLGSEEVIIRATVDGEVIGEEMIERTVLPAARRPRYIYDETMVANYYEPDLEAEGGVPAVIVLGGSDGGMSPYTELTAALLAARGYATLALAYFGLGQLPPSLSEIPLEYFGDAVAWLQDQPGVDPERIGVVGTSRGGELALLLGSTYPNLKAVVSYVGSGYVHPEYIGLASDVSVSAWTWRGEPVRHLDAYEMTEAELREAEIPVERINGPVLLIGADDDRLWPSSNLSNIAWKRLQREGHPWPDQFLRYPGAGHGISIPPYVPVSSFVSAEMGGTPLGNATAMANAWPAVTHMLDARLKH